PPSRRVRQSPVHTASSQLLCTCKLPGSQGERMPLMPTIRPPPTSSLFPYTTLFRSSPLAQELLQARNAEQTLARKGLLANLNALDRKSTRLNSITDQSRMPSSA